MEHTKTPWHIGMKPGPMIYGTDGEQVADMHFPMVTESENTANAALIVKCVNSHDALVAALENITSAYDRALDRFGAHEWGKLTVEDAREALKLAKGE